ncbi:methyl-accepting chemotaxis protein [Alicyclobacillus cellulosilyticus]|uniref:Methyl-accepting chemotaxis protein n=1 Tax=Alicyclobacillus cellulosilyticus TaxID=1003997 RepID=A0A917KG76_9BACL|nr:methyl-accepting chemotaxis protein [Alicyclobacillus cellulosilyticus]GGJ11128.1 methyl-accepting chemotaxis protein [Alicyclobacillus cellulosilyticus]
MKQSPFGKWLQGVRGWRDVKAVKDRVQNLGQGLKVITIGKKLAVGFVIINVITILLGLLNLSAMQRISNYTHSVIHDQMDPVVTLLQVQQDIQEVNRDLLKVATAALGSKSANDFYAMVTEIGSDISTKELALADDLQTLSKTTLVEQDKQDWQKAADAIINLTSDTQNDLNNITNAYGGNGHQAITLASEKDLGQVQTFLTKMLTFAKQQSAGAESGSRAVYLRAAILSWLGLAVAVAVSVLVVVVLIRSVTRSLKSITRQMHDIAGSHGDLTQRLAVKSRDEMGLLSLAFNAMMDNLQRLVQRVAESADKVQSLATDISAWSEQVLSGAEEIASASQQIASAAESQSEHLHGASEQIQEMVTQLSGLRQAADVALSKAASNTRATVEEGQRAADTVEAHMQDVNAVMEGLAAQMGSLKDQAARIGKIVEVIAEIAGQSRLLALNASIEAARAGEHGKGFAVVALEVRKLADQSRSAALDIQQIVRGIQGQVEAAVATADEVRDRLSQGKVVVDTSRSAFDRIREAVDAVAAEIQQTMASIESVVAEAHAVSSRMGEVVKAAENSVANAEEVSAAIEQQTSSLQHTASAIHDLARMAEGLKEMIGQFKY